MRLVLYVVHWKQSICYLCILGRLIKPFRTTATTLLLRIYQHHVYDIQELNSPLSLQLGTYLAFSCRPSGCSAGQWRTSSTPSQRLSSGSTPGPPCSGVPLTSRRICRDSIKTLRLSPPSENWTSAQRPVSGGKWCSSDSLRRRRPSRVPKRGGRRYGENFRGRDIEAWICVWLCICVHVRVGGRMGGCVRACMRVCNCACVCVVKRFFIKREFKFSPWISCYIKCKRMTLMSLSVF